MAKKKKQNPIRPQARDPASVGADKPEASKAAFTVLTPEGEYRRPEIDQSYARNRSKDYVNLADMARAEDELQRTKEEAGIVEKGSWWKRLINRYYQWKDERPRHFVRKRVYLILNLLLGWCGIHRFYERRWLLGLFYLCLFWTGLPAILCVTDFLIALPMKADEGGMILI